MLLSCVAWPLPLFRSPIIPCRLGLFLQCLSFLISCYICGTAAASSLVEQNGTMLSYPIYFCLQIFQQSVSPTSLEAKSAGTRYMHMHNWSVARWRARSLLQFFSLFWSYFIYRVATPRPQQFLQKHNPTVFSFTPSPLLPTITIMANSPHGGELKSVIILDLLTPTDCLQRSPCERLAQTFPTRCRGWETTCHCPRRAPTLRPGIDPQRRFFSAGRYVVSFLGGG